MRHAAHMPALILQLALSTAGCVVAQTIMGMTNDPGSKREVDSSCVVLSALPTTSLVMLLSLMQAATFEGSLDQQQQRQPVSAEERERRSIDAALEAWLVGTPRGIGG